MSDKQIINMTPHKRRMESHKLDDSRKETLTDVRSDRDTKRKTFESKVVVVVNKSGNKARTPHPCH